MSVSPIRIRWLLVVFMVSGVAGWIMAFIAAERGWPAPILGYAAAVTLGAVAVLLLVAGLRIRSDRKRPVADRMNPIAAVRVLVLAQASTYAATLFVGWHAGVMGDRIPAAGVDHPVVIQSIITAAVSVVLVIVGMIVEAWCRIPPDGEDPEDRGKNSSREDGPGGPGVPVTSRNEH